MMLFCRRLQYFYIFFGMHVIYSKKPINDVFQCTRYLQCDLLPKVFKVFVFDDTWSLQKGIILSNLFFYIINKLCFSTWIWNHTQVPEYYEKLFPKGK